MLWARPNLDPSNSRDNAGGGGPAGPRKTQTGSHTTSDNSAPQGACNQPGGRLNLLLSYGGCQVESWCDRLPPLLEPMGIQSFRAGTARHASKVIASTPIHIAVVDLALPLDETPDPTKAEEAGPRLLDLLARLERPPATLVVKRSRTHRDDAREMAAALRLGAFAVLDRPRDLTDLNVLLEVMRRVLTRFHAGRWPNLPNNFA